MANNFRLTASRYISKDGNNGNSGTTADLPKLTFAKYVDGSHIVGTGEYKGGVNVQNAINTTFTADTLVKLNLTSDVVANHNGGADKVIFNGIRFEFNGNDFYTRIGINNFSNCVLKDGGFRRQDALNSTSTMTNCIIESMVYDAVGTGAGAMNITFNNGLIFNSTDFKCLSLKNSYVDSASSLQAYPATFNNNNFQGSINAGGNTYELKQDKDGNAIDPNPAFLDAIALDASIYTKGNFSQEPEFLNIEKRDYWSVANTSPMLFANDAGTGNIGNTNVATLKKVTDTEFSTGIITGLSLSVGDFIVDSVTGDVLSQPIEVAVIAQVLGVLNFAEALTFNSSQALGSAENDNVVSVFNYTALTAGANPRRLTYEMRWTEADTQPTATAEWTNQFYLTAGLFGNFEQFLQPMIDPAMKGNGEPDYTAVGSAKLKARWVQFRISMFEGIG